MIVYACGFSHESHSFSKRLTTIEDFAGAVSGSIDAQPDLIASRSIEGGILSAARDFGWTLTFPFFAQAIPSGPVTTEAFDIIAGRLIDGLKRLGKVDGVLLPLHGSMFVVGYPDSEGEIIARVRDVVGPEVPIAVLLDLHANASDRMTALADIATSYRTTPHTDHWETAHRAAALLDRAMRGEIRPCATVARLPMMAGLDMGRTIDPEGPMRQLLDVARAIECDDPRILDVSLNAGFYYGDVEDAGPSVIVVGDGEDAGHVAVAERLIREAWKTRDYVSIAHLPVAEAVAKAIAVPAGDGPVILADYTDGMMGGGYGDGTALLAELLRIDPAGTVVGPIFDPVSVGVARGSGVGATVALTIGGRQDPTYGGGPISVAAEVVRLSDGDYRRKGAYATGTIGHMGDCALVRVGQVSILLVSLLCQPEDREQYRIVGVDPERTTIMAMKGINHFRADFEAIAREIIFVDSGGLVSVDFTRFPFRNVRRPIWPLDADVAI